MSDGVDSVTMVWTVGAYLITAVLAMILVGTLDQSVPKDAVGRLTHLMLLAVTAIWMPFLRVVARQASGWQDHYQVSTSAVFVAAGVLFWPGIPADLDVFALDIAMLAAILLWVPHEHHPALGQTAERAVKRVREVVA